MKVASILKVKGTTVETTPPRTSIARSARLLRDKHIGALVVSEDGTGVLGITPERDIVHGLADRGPSLLDLPVSLVMTRTPVTCTPDDDIQTVMSQMTRLRLRHLPVVVGGRLQGIVSIGDVVKHRLDELATEANVLRDAFLARQYAVRDRRYRAPSRHGHEDRALASGRPEGRSTLPALSNSLSAKAKTWP